jgi:hypothetical protein
MKTNLVILFLFISGCSTTKTAHVACDFVAGASDNALERHENKSQSDIHGNTVNQRKNSDFLEGVLNVFGGMASRALNNKETEPCSE